jgi:hypothetical protein
LIAAVAIALAIALLVVGGVALWGALTSEPAQPGPGSSKADPPVASQSVASGKVRSSATATTADDGYALVVRCRVARCGVFISSVPDNDVLFNGNLGPGEERHADEPRMNLVVSDGSTVDVYINGRLQTKGSPNKRKYYTIVKS